MFLLRDVRTGDLDDLLRLAKLLNTINLPEDVQVLEALIERSEGSFAGRIDANDARYLFVIADTDKDRVVGTSLIIASHGTPDDPHNYFRVDVDERYSPTLGQVFRHETLTFRQSYTPHTEIGGLILDPEYRGHPQRLGRLLSFVRFLYMAIHRGRFGDRVQAELLPPFESDGTSRLWEAVGRKYTGLDYEQADRFSRQDPEFIRDLFPRAPIYLSLLPESVREVVGAVGARTKGVERMLVDIGFRFNSNIDPFDGGPHFEGRTSEISIIRDAFQLAFEVGEPGPEAEGGMVAHLSNHAPSIRAVPSRFLRRGGRLVLPEQTVAALHLAPSDTAAAVPIRSLR